jgi:hypothetical protein
MTRITKIKGVPFMQNKTIALMTALLISGQVFAQTTQDKNKKKKPAKKETAVTPATAAASTSAAPLCKPAEEKPVDLGALIAPLTLGELKFLQYMKDHFNASYHGEYYFQRRDGGSPDPEQRKLQDFRMLHSPTVIYKPNKKWQILATAEFKYSDVDGEATFPDKYYRGLVSITRKGLLNEADHKIGMDLGFGRRDFNNSAVPTTNGNWRIFTTLTKTLGKNNASLFVQYLRNDPKSWKADTWKMGLELNPSLNVQINDKLSYLFNDDININSPYDGTSLDKKYTVTHEMNVAYFNYQWNDKINTYYQFKYYHQETFQNYSQGASTDNDYFEHYAGIGYALNAKTAVTLEVGGEVIAGDSSNNSFSKKYDTSKKLGYPDIALYFDFAL